MTAYGILLVNTSWSNEDLIQIDKTTHLRHRERLVEGTQALIYVREPVDALVAEATITAPVLETETEPRDPAFNPAIPANLRLEREIDRVRSETEPSGSLTPNHGLEKTFRVPLAVTRYKGRVEPIPLNRIQALLGSDFSVFDETWIPLTETQYEQLVALWEQKENAQ